MTPLQGNIYKQHSRSKWYISKDHLKQFLKKKITFEKFYLLILLISNYNKNLTLFEHDFTVYISFPVCFNTLVCLINVDSNLIMHLFEFVKTSKIDR